MKDTITEKILAAARFDEEKALLRVTNEFEMRVANWQSEQDLILITRLAKIIEEQNKALEFYSDQNSYDFGIAYRQRNLLSESDMYSGQGGDYLYGGKQAKKTLASVNQQLALLEDGK